MKSKFRPIYILFFTLLTAFTFLNNSANPPNGRTGAPGDGLCSDCHSGNNPNGYAGSVQIMNFPSSIIPNTVYSLQAVIDITAGTPARAGFQAVVLDGSNNNAGDLTPTGPSTTTQSFNSREYVEHNPAMFFGGNSSVTYTFDWLAPNAPNGEIITLYTASVIANGSGTANDLVVTNFANGIVMSSGGNPPTATATSTPVSCFGGNNGTASAIGSGGTPGYSYLWSNGCLVYTSPSPRDQRGSRMPSSA